MACSTGYFVVSTPTLERRLQIGFYANTLGWGNSSWCEDDGSLGALPQRYPGAKPLVRGSGAKPPPQSWKLFVA